MLCLFYLHSPNKQISRHDVIYVDKLTYCIQGTNFLIDGGLSCSITANHVKECHLYVNIKDWSPSQIFSMAFTITASISLGENMCYVMLFILSLN